MKKLNLLLVLSLMFTLFSCENDDDGEANLAGTWEWTASKEDGETVILDECDLLDTMHLFMNDQGENHGIFVINYKEAETSEKYTWSLRSENMLSSEAVDDAFDKNNSKNY